jgi:hypothetical protein
MGIRASDYDQTRFWRAPDLSAEKKFKIKKATVETIGQGRDREDKLVVWFTNSDKGLVLNKTNNRVIRGAFGDDTDGWNGKVIVVFPTMADMRGSMVPALRVKLPPPKSNGEAAAAPAPKPPTDPELNDEVSDVGGSEFGSGKKDDLDDDDEANF